MDRAQRGHAETLDNLGKQDRALPEAGINPDFFEDGPLATIVPELITLLPNAQPPAVQIV
ncbi:MAG: hypothetical protein KKB37_01555 [Alphaproteobacteria bacterium]|nr:hypothetical protein [Alphaproteobacteria bacterium]